MVTCMSGNRWFERMLGRRDGLMELLSCQVRRIRVLRIVILEVADGRMSIWLPQDAPVDVL